MNLEQIQEMWEKDSKIDPDNLHDESLKNTSTSLKVLHIVQYNYFVKRKGKRVVCKS